MKTGPLLLSDLEVFPDLDFTELLFHFDFAGFPSLDKGSWHVFSTLHTLLEPKHDFPLRTTIFEKIIDKRVINKYQTFNAQYATFSFFIIPHLESFLPKTWYWCFSKPLRRVCPSLLHLW